MIDYKEIIDIVQTKYLHKLTKKFKPFSFVYNVDIIVVILSYNYNIQIITFYNFEQRGLFCEASIMNFTDAIFVSRHLIERFQERFSASPKYTMLELLAKELVYLIDAINSGWIYTKHGKLYITKWKNKIICKTFARDYKQPITNPQKNWFTNIQTMKKILIIPDVHGRTFWRKVLDLDLEHIDKIVFLGDYTDPYPHEQISYEQSIAEMEEIIDFKKENKDKVILLLGNHELHYIDNNFACSRYSYKFRSTYQTLLLDNENFFQLAFETQIENKKYLFTHAGVTEGWANYVNLKEYGETPSEMINNLYKLDFATFGQISYFRGGNSMHGSCIWADINEHEPMKRTFEDYYQIFGHTINYHIVNPNYAMIDNSKLYILDSESLKPY